MPAMIQGVGKQMYFLREKWQSHIAKGEHTRMGGVIVAMSENNLVWSTLWPQ